MSLEQEILFKEMNTYLRVSCRGKWNSEIALEIFLQIKQKAKQTKHTRILLDCLEVGPPRNNSDRISAGLDIAAMLGHPYKNCSCLSIPFNDSFSRKNCYQSRRSLSCF